MKKDVNDFGMDEKEWADKAQNRGGWRKMLHDGILKRGEEMMKEEKKKIAEMRERNGRQANGLTCAECGVAFRSQRGVSQHMRQKHGGGRKEEIFVCERCGKECTSRSGLVRHMNAKKC